MEAHEGVDVLDHIRRVGWPIAAAVAVLAYGYQPLLRFAQPGGLMLSCTLITAAGMIAFMATTAKHTRVWLAISLIVGIVATGKVLCTMSLAEWAVEQNDIRCGSIQAHMLEEAVTREADATMFAALQCRPQGQQLAQWPSSAETRLMPIPLATAPTSRRASETGNRRKPCTMHHPGGKQNQAGLTAPARR